MPENHEYINNEGLSDPIDGKNEPYIIQKNTTPYLSTNEIYKNLQIVSNKWIEMACNLAADSVKNGGGPFGAIILQIDDETREILRYWTTTNQVTKINDPTAHAEISAIRSACRSLGVFNLGKIDKTKSILQQIGQTSHCEIFSSCEPCPMCYSAIFWARIPVLYFAATRFDASQQEVGFSDKELYDELKTSYLTRKTNVYQCITKNSLDAFHLWSDSDRIEY